MGIFDWFKGKKAEMGEGDFVYIIKEQFGSYFKKFDQCIKNLSDKEKKCFDVLNFIENTNYSYQIGYKNIKTYANHQWPEELKILIYKILTAKLGVSQSGFADRWTLIEMESAFVYAVNSIGRYYPNTENVYEKTIDGKGTYEKDIQSKASWSQENVLIRNKILIEFIQLCYMKRFKISSIENNHKWQSFCDKILNLRFREEHITTIMNMDLNKKLDFLLMFKTFIKATIKPERDNGRRLAEITMKAKQEGKFIRFNTSASYSSIAVQNLLTETEKMFKLKLLDEDYDTLFKKYCDELKKYNNQKKAKKESLLKKSKELAEKKRLEELEHYRKEAEAKMYKEIAEKKSKELAEKKRLEELEQKEEIKEASFKNSTKFTEELKKYIKTHNESAVIEVFPSNGGVWEEYIYRGTWNSKKFKMKASIPLKNAEYQYDGNLSNFIEQIGTKKITDLDDSNLDIELLGDSGGSWQVDEVNWEPALTVKEEFEVDEYDLVDFEMDYDEDDFIFEKGCIHEIKVTIGNKTFTLVK